MFSEQPACPAPGLAASVSSDPSLTSFSTWLERQGHTILRSASTCWYDAGPRAFQAFPYHRVVQPTEEELRRLFWGKGVLAMRYSAPLSGAVGHISYHVVYTGAGYAIEDLPKKARYDVRKGLAHAGVEPISFARLASEGWELMAETLARQGRSSSTSRAAWERLCHSAEGLPGFEAWAAIHDTRLVAALLAFTGDDCCSILFQQSATEHLASGVNNALAYVFTREVLGRSGVSTVFYGLHSLDAPASVDQFKFRMNFEARPVLQRVALHPLLEPMLQRVGGELLRRWPSGLRANAAASKLEGLLRFYLDGLRPIAAQEWPAALAEQKECILSRLSG